LIITIYAYICITEVENGRLEVYAINYSLKLISFNLFPLNYLFIYITYVRCGNGSAVNVSPERYSYKFLALSQLEPKIFSISGSFAVPSCTNIVKTDVMNKFIRCLIIYILRHADTRYPKLSLL